MSTISETISRARSSEFIVTPAPSGDAHTMVPFKALRQPCSHSALGLWRSAAAPVRPAWQPVRRSPRKAPFRARCYWRKQPPPLTERERRRQVDFARCAWIKSILIGTSDISGITSVPSRRRSLTAVVARVHLFQPATVSAIGAGTVLCRLQRQSHSVDPKCHGVQLRNWLRTGSATSPLRKDVASSRASSYPIYESRRDDWRFGTGTRQSAGRLQWRRCSTFPDRRLFAITGVDGEQVRISLRSRVFKPWRRCLGSKQEC